MRYFIAPMCVLAAFLMGTGGYLVMLVEESMR